jgi:DNA-binding CsgD family transcriptional regulator
MSPRTANMIELYKSGKTLQEIGDLYLLSRERVRQILTEVGVSKNDGGLVKRSQSRSTEVAELLKQGKTTDEVSKELSLSNHSVYALIHKYPELQTIKLAAKPVKFASRETIEEVITTTQPQSFRELAITLGFHEKHFQEWLRRKHPDLLKLVSRRPTSQVIDQRRRKIKKWLKLGFTKVEMAKRLKIKYGTLMAWLHQNEVK